MLAADTCFAYKAGNRMPSSKDNAMVCEYDRWALDKTPKAKLEFSSCLHRGCGQLTVQRTGNDGSAGRSAPAAPYLYRRRAVALEQTPSVPTRGVIVLLVKGDPFAR